MKETTSVRRPMILCGDQTEPASYIIKHSYGLDSVTVFQAQGTNRKVASLNIQHAFTSWNMTRCDAQAMKCVL